MMMNQLLPYPIKIFPFGVGLAAAWNFYVLQLVRLRTFKKSVQCLKFLYIVSSVAWIPMYQIEKNICSWNIVTEEFRGCTEIHLMGHLVNNGWSNIFVLFCGGPYAGGKEGSQDRPANPYSIFPVRSGVNMDLHTGRYHICYILI